MEGNRQSSAVLDSLLALSLREGVRTRERLLENCRAELAAAATLVRDAVRAGHKILLCGNGGSAADAQHIAAELVGRFVRERAPLPAIALTVDTSILTSIGNDYGFEHIFARQVEALGAAGDVLVAISTSGKSPNVIAACRAARARGVHVLGLTGGSGGLLGDLSDVCIRVPSRNTSRIQECHLTIGHLLCEVVDHLADGADLQPAPPETRHHRKHLSLKEAVALRPHWRARGLTVVWTNGCFDVLHLGHVQSLLAARAEGDLLVVGLNSDSSVRALKGESRPTFPIAERVGLLGSLEAVDQLVVFDEATPEAALAALQPDVHCKGANYAPPNGDPIPEAKLVESYGGRLAFLPLVPGLSTTAVLGRLGARLAR
jgi:phosphoheptose isomerase